MARHTQYDLPSKASHHARQVVLLVETRATNVHARLVAHTPVSIGQGIMEKTRKSRHDVGYASGAEQIFTLRNCQTVSQLAQHFKMYGSGV